MESVTQASRSCSLLARLPVPFYPWQHAEGIFTHVSTVLPAVRLRGPCPIEKRSSVLWCQWEGQTHHRVLLPAQLDAPLLLHTPGVPDRNHRWAKSPVMLLIIMKFLTWETFWNSVYFLNWLHLNGIDPNPVMVSLYHYQPFIIVSHKIEHYVTLRVWACRFSQIWFSLPLCCFSQVRLGLVLFWG